MIEVINIINGYLEENCYIIKANNKCLIVDPGSEGNRIINEIETLKLEVKGILITHYHFDHIGALDEIRAKYKCDIYDYNCSDINKIDCFSFKKINNFGHTMDSCSFFFEKEKIMFTGDFVFYESIGKYDKENEKEMIKSLKEFKKLDDDIIIYPGHGPSSNVGYEKNNNYFLRGI